MYTRRSMKLGNILFSVLFILALASCNDEPKYADPEAHEKTTLLNEQYAPLIVGTWYYENTSDKHRFHEQLTFKADGTLTGIRKWQGRSLVTIDGEERFTDWKDVEELNGSFTGTWNLRYGAPDGNDRRNCLILHASYDNKEYMAYSYVATFDYANETTLRFKGYYYNDADGWTNYHRGNMEPSF